MYPGAQDGKFVPFVCPMDHALSPSAVGGRERASSVTPRSSPTFGAAESFAEHFDWAVAPSAKGGW